MLSPGLYWELASILLAATATAAASVNVALEASFNTPPYLLELLETAAHENSSSYFPLLDRIAEGRFADQSTEADLYAAFLVTLRDDGHIQDDDTLSSFELAMSLHEAAPRIQAHYQYYDTYIEPLLMVAQDAACPIWIHFDEKQYCSPTLERAQQDFSGPAEQYDLPFDRILSLDPDIPVSTLYVDLNSPLFAHFHQTLTETAHSGRTTYRIRYRPSLAVTGPLPVSGYGVELALKRTDYIVIDDRNAEDNEAVRMDSAQKAVSKIEEYDVLESEQVNDLKPLSSSELSGIGMKAASFVMASKEPLDVLQKLAQDFPKHSSAIAKLNQTEAFVAEHKLNRKAWLASGYNVIWMNGKQIEPRQMDAYTLLSKLRYERKLIKNFKNIGLGPSEAISLLSHRAIAEARYGEEPIRYDYRDTLEGGRSIIWLNDLEKDSRYKDWTTLAGALVQPTYPGMLPMIRRDVHNAVIPVDLVSIEGVEEVVERLQQLVQRKIAVRFGIVPILITPEAEKQAKIIYYLLEKYGLTTVMSYLRASLEDRKNPGFSEARFKDVLHDIEPRKDQETLSVTEILDGDEYQELIIATKNYFARLGANGASPPAFVNGVPLTRDDAFLQVMSNQIGADLRSLQQKFYEEPFADELWIAGSFLEGAITYRNPLIVPVEEEDEKILNIMDVISQYSEAFRELPRIPASAESTKQFWAYLIIVADLDSDRGAKLIEQAIEYRKLQMESTLVFVHNPSPKSSANARSAELFKVLSSKHELTVEDALRFLSVDVESVQHDEMAETFWERMRPLILSLGVKPGQNHILLNGRTVGPISSDTKFTAEDFTQLLNYERSKRIAPVNTALAETGLEEKLQTPLEVAQLTSMLAIATLPDPVEGVYGGPTQPRMDDFKIWQSSHTAIATGDEEAATIRLVASIDPTSENAQRFIPILKVLSELQGVSLKLFLNPRETLEELPVKRFYRYVLEAKPSFGEDGSINRPQASFDGMPKDALLNAGMNVPPAWLVAPKESAHDLDNIKLSSVKGGGDVNAIYELQNILIEGHSRDVTTGQPPRGAQLLLGTEQNDHYADTLIMANLGYFQFKANPGYWNIQLKAGRSQEIYQIDTIGASGSPTKEDDQNTQVALMSFQGLTLFPRLSRKQGMEEKDVLEEGSDVLTKASKFASGFLSNVGLGKRSKHTDINIFSVASGHLYERMLSIMMVSVMRHTKHTVKFWFIEQFLSPSFKQSLPKLAEHYGFDFEMVTYKWPHWLRGQKEKQREIWGYKILFLDVLFPLSLDKVIFVDADQVVRTDMYELVTHDLQGAPYGFTPMCDSRTEMEGFRFWKQGYWKNFLRGLPYHISALYVVDLKAFRQMAAGDRLRGQYHQLSADPNSLSNLDQDLPNHMQMALPIHSLPQDWLWCETWCSDAALATAKTIDLCNNPQTKEPKLDRARRQVPEWTVYDDEIAAVLKDKVGGSGEAMVVQERGSVQEELDSERAESEAAKTARAGERESKDNANGEKNRSKSLKKDEL